MAPAGHESHARRAAFDALARVFAPRRPLSPSEWAAAYRRMTAKTTAKPGPWQNERIPFLRGIMDALSPEHPAPLVVLCKSSQVGGSECGVNWIGATIHQRPGNFLCLFPTDKVGRKWKRSKFDPMVASTPELRRLVGVGRRKVDGSTMSETQYPGGTMYLGSAGVPDDVASISVPFLLFDELDRMPVALADEGDPVELAFRRQATFTMRKAFANSTPTTEETSRIWPMYLGSTRDRYFVPCTHCGHMQVLAWSGLKWIAGKPRTASYACAECGGMIDEHRKADMLAAGEWRAEFPERESIVKGFHVSGLYTPFGFGDSWADHAQAWERAEGKPARVQVFFNTRLGEVHRGERVTIDWQVLHGRRESIRLRDVPADVLLLTSGSDVQADRIETQVVGWGRNGRVVPIDYAVHYGDPTRDEVWNELDAYLQREFVHAGGARMRLACSMIDAGYLPDHVLQFTRARDRVARNVYACRGSTIAKKIPIGKPTLVDVKHRGQSDKRGAERYELGVSEIKHWLFEVLRSDEGTPDKPVLAADRHVRFSDELSEDYFRQLCAETYDPAKGWIARANYHRNEALDTFVYARAAAMHHRVALHRMREPDFERIEATLRDGAKAPAAVLGKDAVPSRGGFLPTVARVQND
jgi:phage terminase large subunit GpA-like protein